MTRPTDQELDQRIDEATQTLKKLSEEHAKVAGITASAEAYTYTAMFDFAAVFVWTKIATNSPVKFSDGTTKGFDGNVWGPGFGAGFTWGGGVFNVSPSSLGKCDVQVTCSPNTTAISFWSRGKPLGVFTGAGLGVGATVGAGSGAWS